MSDDAILSAQKSFLRGPVTNNGFVNFMRDYAAKSGGLDVPDAITGGKLWNRLTSAQRKSYRMVDAEGEDNENEDSSSDKGSDNEDVEMGDGDDTDDTMDDGCCPKKRKRKPCCPPPCPRRKRRKPCCPPSPCCPKRRKRKPCCPKPKPCCPKPRRKPCCPRPKKRKPCCPTPCCPRPKPRPRPCCPRPKKRRCPRPRPRCPKKNRCMRPGPITNNGYLNFLRFYRRKHCGLKPKELIMKAARAWCRLPECKKNFYRRQSDVSGMQSNKKLSPQASQSLHW